MIRYASLLAVLSVAGCASGTQDTLAVVSAGATRAAQSPPDLAAVAQALDARKGERLSGDLTILGAAAQGRRLDMRFRHDRDAAEFSPSQREGYALVATRAMVDEAEANDFETHVRRELEEQMVIGETADAKEGVAAFVEKRKPEFTGR